MKRLHGTFVIMVSVVDLVERWNGTSWNVVPSPYRRSTGSSLSAVSADSAADVWVAGSDINTQNFVYHTLIEHYC